LLLNGLVGVATFSIDRILINKSLGMEEVGIYQAHFLATYGIISAFMTILLTYVFPAFCRDEKNNIHDVMGKLSKIQYPVTIFISILTGSTVLWLYSYPVSLALFASLCLFNGVQFHVQLKTWYIASRGKSGSKITLKSQIVFLISNITILLILIQRFGIFAGGAALLAASCLTLGYLLKTEKIIFHERII
jgi:O-antigen/teichoic acid export membrane protein